MPSKEEWVAPPDPDFDKLAAAGYFAWCLDKPKVIAFDTETTGVEFFDRPFCTTVAWQGQNGLEAHYFEHGCVGRENKLREILVNTPWWIGHNLKFDLQKEILVGIISREEADKHVLHDTEALAHLDDEHREKGLKKLAVTVLKEEDVIEVEVQSGPNKGTTRFVPREKHEMDMVRRKLKKKIDDGFHVIPRAVVVPYAIKDAELTLRLYQTLNPKVYEHEDLYRLYRQEMALMLVFLDMESRGMGVDSAYVDQTVTEYNKKVLRDEEEIESITGRSVGKGAEDFNPNSNPQIAAFFSSAGLEREKYDEEVLSELDHPLAPALLQLRSDSKMLKTYLRALKTGTVDGVFHPSIRQHGTVTGRTSSGGAKGDG